MKSLGMIFASVMILVVATTPAWGQMSDMKMSAPANPAQFAPTREAYTTDHQFLVKLVSVPNPIPFEKYFKMRFAIYDGSHPSEKISDVQVGVFAGMRHGMENGFAHSMQSSPKVEDQNGVVTVSGMYFHMMGPWTVKTTVRSGDKEGVAYFQLPCCTQ